MELDLFVLFSLKIVLYGRCRSLNLCVLPWEGCGISIYNFDFIETVLHHLCKVQVLSFSSCVLSRTKYHLQCSERQKDVGWRNTVIHYKNMPIQIY